MSYRCAYPRLLPPAARFKMKVPSAASPVSSVWRLGRCGQCRNCLAFYRAVWEGRVMLEWLYRDCVGAMVTFTYRDGNLPDQSSQTVEERLGVADLRRYLHSFKQACRDRREPVPSIFWASEFGGRKDRPHHHVIFLGKPISWHRTREVAGVMESQLIGFPWQHGFVNLRRMGDFSDPDGAKRAAQYLSKYVVDKRSDRVVRGRAAGLGKDAIKALFLQSLAARNPDKPPAFVFSSAFYDLGQFCPGLGTYPMCPSMHGWVKDVCDEYGIAYERPYILNPHLQPPGLEFYQPELVKERSDGDRLGLKLLRRQTRHIRERG